MSSRHSDSDSDSDGAPEEVNREVAEVEEGRRRRKDEALEALMEKERKTKRVKRAKKEEKEEETNHPQTDDGGSEATPNGEEAEVDEALATIRYSLGSRLCLVVVAPFGKGRLTGLLFCRSLRQQFEETSARKEAEEIESEQAKKDSKPFRQKKKKAEQSNSVTKGYVNHLGPLMMEATATNDTNALFRRVVFQQLQKDGDTTELPMPVPGAQRKSKQYLREQAARTRRRKTSVPISIRI